MLVHDVLILIFSLLDVRDWCNTRTVCTYFFRACNDIFVTSKLLNIESASKTWKDFIYKGKTDKDNIDFLKHFIEKKFVCDTVCFNPYTFSTSGFYIWGLKEFNVKEEMEKIEIHNYTPNSLIQFIHYNEKLHDFSSMLNIIMTKTCNFLYMKKDILNPSQECNYENPLDMLRLELLFNIQTKINFIEKHCFNIKRNIDEASLTRKCYTL